MISRQQPPYPTIPLPLRDGENLLSAVTSLLIASNVACERAMNDPKLSSDQRAAIAEDHGRLAQAVLNLTTLTREARRDYHETVDAWKVALKEEMHADRLRAVGAGR